MSKFKVGDRVVVNHCGSASKKTTGREGTVASVDESTRPVEVDFGECVGGYKSWWFREEHIDFAPIASFSIISPHYTTDSTGKDYLQRFFENSTPEEVKGAMVFTMGKYIDRLGKKDAPEKELAKIIDYATRYRDFLNK